MQKPYKNPNSNARFVAARSCAVKFMDRGVKFFALQNAGFFATKFSNTKFCNAKPEAHVAALGGFKFRDEKFNGAKFATCGTEFLGANFRGTEFCKSKFRARGVKFYKARLRETGFLARAAKFYAAKFHGMKFSEMKFRTPNLELKMKFNAAKFLGVKFRSGALFKFIAAKGLRRSPSLCAAAPFKFTALQNAGFFATKFDEAEFYGVKFHKTRSRRKKFYATKFAAKGEKFCGMKRRGADA
ncbi:hypothetical protein [uncultured Campylobacter sp.]|uniref:hypothetical protein n=1 Tax=uncultured Campylobacter sp. TaxID=218934 RepID=UPI002617AB85|nr:hypothetical protein [uncultured Campylobacter sp.]